MRLVLLLLLAASLLFAQSGSPIRVGPLPEGRGTLLPTGWIVPGNISLRPLSSPLPTNSLLSPRGTHLLILSSGQLQSVSNTTNSVISTLALPGATLGLLITPDGRTLYVSGGAEAVVYEVSLSAEGALERKRTFPLAPSATRKPTDFAGHLALTPDGRLIYIAGLLNDTISVINPQSGRVIERFPAPRRPFRILFHPDGKSYFVTSWTSGSLHQYMTDNGSWLGSLRIAPHTTDMIWRDKPTQIEKTSDDAPSPFPFKARIFVSASNTNRVYSVGITETKEMRLIESLDVSISPRQPLGMTPSALALNADQSLLFIACSDANAIAVADVTNAHARVLGFIPSGAYPTALQPLPANKLAVLNRDGTASTIDPFDGDTLGAYTQTTFSSYPYDDRLLDGLDIPNGNPIPGRPGEPSSIQHVVYILRPGRTYQETFTQPNPNQQKLASEFVRFDNFYVCDRDPSLSLTWASSAIAPRYLYLIPSAPVSDLAALPPAGYLWTQARSAGVSVRSYGLFNPSFPPDKTPDADRIKSFLDDLSKSDNSGSLPRLTILHAAIDDRTLGILVEACSRSKFWPAMAVFVANTATAGNDPVSPYRAPAFILSPYTRRAGLTDSNFYNSASMLRTIELVLGLRPMTWFDAAAPPMWNALAPAPNSAPFTPALH